MWAGERPYSLWRAEVSDDGTVAGHAYAAGLDGGKDDALLVVILAPDGSTRLVERNPRSGFASEMGAPEPMVLGQFLAAAGARFVLRVTPRRFAAEMWWSYEVASGRALARFEPRIGQGDEDIDLVHDARPVPGTPLVLVHGASWSPPAHVFALVDGGWSRIWTLPSPGPAAADGSRPRASGENPCGSPSVRARRSGTPCPARVGCGPSRRRACSSFAGTPGEAHLRVHVLSSGGDPLASFVRDGAGLRAAGLAFDGERVVLGLDGSLSFHDLDGRERWRFRPRGAGPWQPFLAAGGEELWVFDGQRTLERFELP